jgi:hypothetical protein
MLAQAASISDATADRKIMPRLVMAVPLQSALPGASYAGNDGAAFPASVHILSAVRRT